MEGVEEVAIAENLCLNSRYQIPGEQRMEVEPETTAAEFGSPLAFLLGSIKKMKKIQYI